jgi:hypothetical protein
MSKQEFDPEDTSRYTLTAIFSFVLVFVLFVSISRCSGNKIPPTEHDQTSEPSYK